MSDSLGRSARKIVRFGLTFFFMLAFVFAVSTDAAESAGVSGLVLDVNGNAVPGAEVSLLTPQQVSAGVRITDPQGKFDFGSVPRGTYLLVVKAKGFAERRLAVQSPPENNEQLKISLAIEPVRDQVTVTADRGSVEDTQAVSQPVNIIDAEKIRQRAKAVVAQAVEEEPGVHLQRTSPTMSGIFVRGLTGNKVNVFVDGVRYSTSAARGGVNTFLNLVDPSSLDTLEVLRGPSSAQYGSDAIGGSVQFLTPTPVIASDRPFWHGSYGVGFNFADVSYGTNATISYASRRFGMTTNLSSHHSNTLRPGAGLDSHASVMRFFNLPSSVLEGSRLPDTAFTQYGGLLKLNWKVANDSNVVLSYARSQQDGGKRYDQLLGGDGNLIADLRNLMLDLFYVRYDKVKLGWFDNVSLVYSFNSQREERVNQGGNGNPNATITHEYERQRVHGVQLYGTKQLGTRNFLLGGLEYYHERMHAPSYGQNPATQVATVRRGRVPDLSRFSSGGIYLQDIFEVIPKRLRFTGSVRYSAASYRALSADSPIVGGNPLWPDDSLRAASWTYRAGAVLKAAEGLNFVANFTRGFRAPHITDLGTLGLTGSGFEVAAPDVAGLGGTIGSSAASTAVSIGLPVRQVGPEFSQSYETGVRFRRSWFETDLTFFVNDISDGIAKQALILPPGAVGLFLGGTPITSQLPNGVVFVAAATNPVLVRANFDDARIWGIEHDMEIRINRSLAVHTVFTYFHAADGRTGLPPNIEGGTPAPDGYIKIRYAPRSGRFWLEPFIHAARRQTRLSNLDLEDRRTGATRTRSSIQNFFRNGARVRGLINPGVDGIFGNADDILIPTGETLLQVQERVLGVGVNSAPLFNAIPGYITFNLRGGFRIGERHDIFAAFENITDRNYRGISWGLDAPGRTFAFHYRAKF